jgi:hypothetical protein
MRLRIAEGWKSMQLAVLTLWNAAARSPAFERHVVDMGVAAPLLALASDNRWPATLRETAAGLLQVRADAQHATLVAAVARA